MLDIPPEVQIRATIRPGSVYYFPEESFQSPEPHYFIVLNTDPQLDSVILLVCASSQIDKVRRRYKRICPIETLIEVTPVQYPGFTVNSIIDCNYVLEKSIDQLVEKLEQEKLKLKEEMNISLVGQLREGVISSPIVERRIKALLRT